MPVQFSIQKKFGDFSLDVQGEFSKGILGVFGPSGSGKSTLLKCICGYWVPDSGEILVDQKFLFSSDKRINVAVERRQIGMVFQDALLFPHLSVRSNVLYGSRTTTITSMETIEEVLDILEIQKLMDRYPHQLSGGERQRAALARVLIHQPALLLMDEPLSSIDLKARHKILHYLKQIHERLRVPIIYVSHSISEMMFLTQNVLTLEHGKNISFGSVHDSLLNKRIWSMIREEDIENIYELAILENDPARGVSVDWGGHVLRVAHVVDRAVNSLRIGIKAREVIVAKQPIEGLSARNQVPVIIEQALPVEDYIVLKTRVGTGHGQHSCLVEITQSAYEEMLLEDHKNVYLIIKARSVYVL